MFNRDIFFELYNKYHTLRTTKVLEEVRDYLDHCGITMPLPRWQFLKRDIRTWKYLEDPFGIINPRFKYSDRL